MHFTSGRCLLISLFSCYFIIGSSICRASKRTAEKHESTFWSISPRPVGCRFLWGPWIWGCRFRKKSSVSAKYIGTPARLTEIKIGKISCFNPGHMICTVSCFSADCLLRAICHESVLCLIVFPFFENKRRGHGVTCESCLKKGRV